jgi:DNA-directed RNA polymerase subunit L
MATFTVSKKNAIHLASEFRNFPVTFVNGVRRVMLSDIPTVVVRDVQILENTTQMPHEMLKHRTELLPIDVLHTDSTIIRDATLKLKIGETPEDRILTTDDFTIESGRDNLIMRDRDLKTPLLFLRLKKGEAVYLKAKLAVEKASQVCTATMSYHVDPERAEKDKKKFVEEGGDPRVFDNFYIQKSYSIDEIGRPNWIDVSVESVGVLAPKDIMKLAIAEIKQQVDSWMNNALEKITRESEKDVYNVKLEQGGHTVGALLQEVIYHSKDVNFVSYDIPHPMKSTMVLRWCGSKKPEDILKETQKTIHEYCEIVEKGL